MKTILRILLTIGILTGLAIFVSGTNPFSWESGERLFFVGILLFVIFFIEATLIVKKSDKISEKEADEITDEVIEMINKSENKQ